MDTKTTQTLTTDATDAALRTAATQFVKLVRDPLAGAIARHLAPGDDSMRGKIAAFLQTEVGTALLASMLSVALSTLPQGGSKAQALARELRVQGMAMGADAAIDVLAEPLRQVIALYLQDPQGAPQLGVAQATTVDFAKAEEKVAR